jgi:hypothetical protein
VIVGVSVRVGVGVIVGVAVRVRVGVTVGVDVRVRVGVAASVGGTGEGVIVGRGRVDVDVGWGIVGLLAGWVVALAGLQPPSPISIGSRKKTSVFAFLFIFHLMKAYWLYTMWVYIPIDENLLLQVPR